MKQQQGRSIESGLKTIDHNTNTDLTYVYKSDFIKTFFRDSFPPFLLTLYHSASEWLFTFGIS